MKLKTLLLGSAAAFAVVGGAQAADLSVAEPVDYVKVCDAFGAGYWYIPGSDTCLKIGGLVQFDVNFHSTTAQDWSTNGSHSASWDMNTEAHVDFSVKSMTEYGPLTAFIEARWLSNNNDASNNVLSLGSNGSYSDSGTKFAYLDTAYLELGMLLVGRTESIYHYFGSYNMDFDKLDAGDNNVDQVRLTWAMSGFGIQLAIEDPRDRWGTNLSSTYSMPDIVGALTWSQGKWDGKLTGGYGETVAGSGFGAQIGAQVKLDQIAPGDKLGLDFAWAQSEVPDFGLGGGFISPWAGGSVWSAVAAFQHFWAPTLSSAVTFQYAGASSESGSPGWTNAYTIAGNLVWAPVSGFTAGVEGDYYKTNASSDDGTWQAKVRLVRSW
jgi:hypothetical protein